MSSVWLSPHLRPRFDERADRRIQVVAGQGRRQLGPDPRPALGNNRIAEGAHVDASRQDGIRHAGRKHGVADHHGGDRVIGFRDLESLLGHVGAEVGGVLAQPVEELTGAAEEVEGGQGGGDDRRRQGIAEQVRP